MAHPESHSSFKRRGHSDHASKVRAFTGESGEKAMIKKAFAEHDKHMHGGKKEKITLKTGGKAKHHMHRAKKADGGRTMKDGRTTQPEQDANNKRDNYGGGHIKPAVHAEGGPTKPRRSGGAKGHGSHVNVIVAPSQPHPMPVPVPMRPPGAGMPPGGPGAAPPPPAGAMPPRPVMPPGAGPVGAPPMMPPGMAGARPMQAAGGRVGRAKGGRVHFDAGAGSGEGRLEKEKVAKPLAHGENKSFTEKAENKGETEHAENRKFNRGGKI